MLGTAASLLSHTKNKRDKSHCSACQDCWRNPSNCWEEKGNIVIVGQRRRKGQSRPKRRINLGTPRSCVLPLQHKRAPKQLQKRKTCRGSPFPRTVFHPGAVAGLGSVTPRGIRTGESITSRAQGRQQLLGEVEESRESGREWGNIICQPGAQS